MKNKYEKFISLIKEFGLEVSDRQLEQFDMYYNLLVSWNEKMNLTAITEFDEVIIKHFADSISLAKYFNLKDVNSVIDVGTGAGFPGIPLKIMFPHLNITLLDSLNKRLVFLNDVIEKCELTSINTIHGRAEDFGKNIEYREKYDICVSRAVANLSTLTELCSPFVVPGGYFIPYKSEKAEEELENAKNAIFLLGCKLEKVEKFRIDENLRNILFIKKIQNTSKKYPRKAGTPLKNPL